MVIIARFCFFVSALQARSSSNSIKILWSVYFFVVTKKTSPTSRMWLICGFGNRLLIALESEDHSPAFQWDTGKMKSFFFFFVIQLSCWSGGKMKKSIFQSEKKNFRFLTKCHGQGINRDIFDSSKLAKKLTFRPPFYSNQSVINNWELKWNENNDGDTRGLTSFIDDALDGNGAP